MNKIHLTAKEKVVLEDRHKGSRDIYERDRLKAVLLRSENWSIESISQALRLHRSTVETHVQDYLSTGKLALTQGGSSSYLDEKQTEALISHLTENTYYAAHQMVGYVKERYGVDYSVAGLNKWLHYHGFSFKKAQGVPHKADTEKQSEFIEDSHHLKQSLKSNEILCFMDGIHPTQATQLSYGWIRTGQDKCIQPSASRTRLNILGAINLKEPEQAVTKHYDSINTASVVDFLRKLRQQYATYKTVHVVLDRASYHTSKEVMTEAQKLAIQLHHLPAYSPNLNPIERLWKLMNEKVRNHRFFKSAKDFKEAINHFLQHELKTWRSELLLRINDNFQQLSI